MNGRRRFLLGTVLAIQSSGFMYPACQHCCSRLTPTSCRYQCSKCGTTYKDPVHRYKLCVKVSEERRLHVITVFGKCLEKIFGASADILHSRLQASSHLPGDLEHDRAQELLFQAAERCLIDRSFIFAVKIPENFGRSESHSTLLQNMVAYQIILLNGDPMSCTILSYFNQLTASVLSNSSINANDCTDTTVRDLSGLEFSESDSSLHQSWNHYADYWQQSLGLVCSPLSSNYRPGECSRTEPVLYPEARTSLNTTIFMQKKLTDTVTATRSSSVVSINTPRLNCSSLKHIHTDTHSPPHSSHFQSFCSKSKMALGQESYLQNVCKSGSCRSQSCSARITQLTPQPAEIHQAKEEIWEDFPFSESLSEFIAKIEDDEGVRNHLTTKESTMTASNGKEWRRSCSIMNSQGARPTANLALVKSASHCGFDKGSTACVFNFPCRAIRGGDTGLVNQTFPLATWFFERENVFDVLPKASTKEQDRQSLTCPKIPLNGAYVNDNLDVCSFIEGLDKTAVSLEKVPKMSDVGMIKISMAGDNYNASADLFESSNDPEDNGTSQLQSLGSPNRGQGRLSCAITHSPCTDVFPYCRRDSRISVGSLLESCETWSSLPTGDFIPCLQSTPILRRLSRTSRLAVDSWHLNTGSISKSSTVSIRTKSRSTIRHIFLKNMRQRRLTVFDRLSENNSFWSPNLSLFSHFEGSTALIPKNRRTMLSDQLWKGETALENKENFNKACSDDDPMCTVKRVDRSNTGREELTKCGGDILQNMGNVSSVRRPLQEEESQQLLPSDWSPELFSEKSNISLPGGHLQRRLF